MIRRFVVGDVEGIEFGDGRVVVNPPGNPRVFRTVADMEDVIGGTVQWLDPPRPTWSPLALAAITAPPLPIAFREFVTLISHTSRVSLPVWTPPAVQGFRRLITPHVLAQHPWLVEVGRVHPDDPEDQAAINAWAVDVERTHPGPHHVEPMSPKAVTTRRMQMTLTSWPAFPVVPTEALSWPSPLTSR